MKKSAQILTVILLSASSLLFSTSANAADGYYPSGPQLNVPISTITSAGWKLCWSSLYGDTDTLANIESSCTGKYLLEAGGAVGASSYILAAAGERSSVLKPTELDQTNLNNGTYWYYSKVGGSMGFSPNSIINQTIADCTYNGARNCGFDAIYIEGEDPTANFRLSWHINGDDETIFGGWRLGHINWLNGGSYFYGTVGVSGFGSDYIRAIYQSDYPRGLTVAKIDSVSFVDDGTGTGGKIVWAGKNIDAVLFTGPESAYPGPYNYGAFTSGWNGRIRNLTADTSYTVSIFAVSSDGVGESKSLTFKTSAALPGAVGAANSTAAQTPTTKLAQMIKWVEENTFLPGEATNMSNLLTKFTAIETSPHRAYIKVPTSRVSKVVATSLTPKSCSVVSATAKVNAGLVTALSGDTCTISYTVTGGSRAPATLVKDFVFKKFAK